MRESRSPPSFQGEALADNSGGASLSFKEEERGVIDVHYVHNVIIVPDVLDVLGVPLVPDVLDVSLVILFHSFLTFFSFFSTLCIYLKKSETSSIY